MWWRNIYSRIKSHGFCEMKSATKYWQVFSAISKDPMRSERRGNGLSLVTGHQDCLIPPCRPDFTTGLPPRPLPGCRILCWGALQLRMWPADFLFAADWREASCTHSFCLKGCLFISRGSHTPGPHCCRSGYFQVELSGEREYRMLSNSFWLSVSKSIQLRYAVYFTRTLLWQIITFILYLTWNRHYSLHMNGKGCQFLFFRIVTKASITFHITDRIVQIFKPFSLDSTLLKPWHRHTIFPKYLKI